MRALDEALRQVDDAPTVVLLQAGDINTGTFDPFGSACEVAHAAKAWVHVDGAIGLWVAASDRYRHLLAGVERADSWATDGHKWLNLPFDSGLVFVRDAAAHHASFAQDTSYSIENELVRNQGHWRSLRSQRPSLLPLWVIQIGMKRAKVAVRYRRRRQMAKRHPRTRYCDAIADYTVRSLKQEAGYMTKSDRRRFWGLIVKEAKRELEAQPEKGGV